jgi:hypothetical protein
MMTAPFILSAIAVPVLANESRRFGPFALHLGRPPATRPRWSAFRARIAAGCGSISGEVVSEIWQSGGISSGGGKLRGSGGV